LKQPLHTSVAIDTAEFSEFNVEEKLHIVISVKDFKTIIMHAGITNNTVSAAYSHPSRPMQLKYTDEGMSTEFILMTIGDFRGSSTTPAPGVTRGISSKTGARQHLEASSNRIGVNAAPSMPPPSRAAAPSISRESSKAKVRRPSPPPPQPSLQSESLFFPDPDDDQRWDPADYDDEDEEPLGWDASANNVR
jgi:cell cycle checkpoint control protein RAD9A